MTMAASACASSSPGPGELAQPDPSTTTTTEATTTEATTATTASAAPTTKAPTTTTSAAPTTTTEPPTTTTTEPPPPALGPGASGPAVVELQTRLTELGYNPGGTDGNYGSQTTSAVMAFQKVEGLGVDGDPGPEVLARLAAPQGSMPSGGSSRIEIDLGRQVLFIVTDGTTRAVNTSTGNGETFQWPDGSDGLAYTPTGTFSVIYRIEGLDEGPLGVMYRPLYFNTGGWAVHGSGFVPAYPASHGCARVSNTDQDWIWDHVPNDTPVVIY